MKLYFLLLIFLLAGCSHLFSEEKWHANMTVKEYFTECGDGYVKFGEAVDKQNRKKMTELTHQSINLNQLGKDSISFLAYAMIKKKHKSFETLLKLGSNPNQLLKDSMTVVAFAAVQEDTYYLTAALNYGGNPNQFWAGGGYTLLEECRTRGLYKQVEILLRYGANPNNRKGATYGTPLQSAASTEDIVAIKLYLNYGADPCLESESGKDSFYDYLLSYNKETSSEETMIFRDSMLSVFEDGNGCSDKRNKNKQSGTN